MTGPLARTPLHAAHVAAGGRMVPFAGYEMPVQYEGVVAEHHAVRQRAGVFDVSHMGELRLRGPEAVAVADGLVTNAIGTLTVGRAAYTACCREDGGILDDLIVYRIGEEEILIVCNASNRGKIAPHVAAASEGRCDFADESDTTALLAVQGPEAIGVAREAGVDGALLDGKPFRLAATTFDGIAVTAARTGYTGEDGLELFCRAEDAMDLWGRIVARGVTPAGLGARDTLRLEAALCLYGNDIDETTNPYEAGLGWVVKLKHGPFVGSEALAKVKAEGITRKLVGLRMVGRGIARHGYDVLDAKGAKIGAVTSGSPGPSVGANIGLAYVPVSHAEAGTRVDVAIRRKTIEAVVVDTPFYRRPR